MEQLDICGGIAQLGEHLPCKQGVSGSIPLTSTIYGYARKNSLAVDGSDRLAMREIDMEFDARSNFVSGTGT